MTVWFAPAHCGGAVKPDSDEVRAMVARALEHLAEQEDDRLGAHCLAGMAFLKNGAGPEHPIVQRAVRICRQASNQPPPIDDVYSNGLAVIFLCELDPEAYEREIGRYLASLYARQKPHGGWGYDRLDTGDTSQTQYAVLGLWTAHRSGVRVNAEAVRRGLDWLMRTQDPSGTWGYQGKDPGGPERVRQSNVSVTMLAAGLGSTLMCAHMFGITKTLEEDRVKEELDLPPAVTRVIDRKESAPPLGGGSQIDRERLAETIRLAREWMDKNYTIEASSYPYYYLYALERYKSFDEIVTGEREESPAWYQDGFEYLTRNQSEDGGWRYGGGGAMADAAFGILFLIRSTQKSLRPGGIGEGLLVGGRGLPENLATASIQEGRLITDETAESVDELLSVLEDPDHPRYEELLDDPRGLWGLNIAEVTDQDVPRLRRLVRGGEPVARVLAVQALATRDDLDDVPTFLYALTDPDRRVVLAARDALRRVSRRTDGFGLGDAFTDRQRHAAIQQWRAWYLTLRPEAVLE